MNFELDFKMIDDRDIKLTYFDQFIYSNIIFFAPSYNGNISTNSDGGIKIENILKFFDAGHDIMIFGSHQAGGYVRKLVNEFGSDFDDYDTKIKDSVYLHNYKESLNVDLLDLKNNEIVVTKNTINIQGIVRLTKGFILYEGIGIETDQHNQYVFPLLKADENAYSTNTESGEIVSNGEKIKLVTAYQARNNRRVVISGSINLCSNQFYFLSSNDGSSPATSPNSVFCQDILNWNFQRTGVLKYENIRHQRVISYLNIIENRRCKFVDL
jgi:oligosaccharyltransferase complex subunit beta